MSPTTVTIVCSASFVAGMLTTPLLFWVGWVCAIRVLSTVGPK